MALWKAADVRVRCLGCKRGSSYRFCSDACFLAYSKTRLHVECAICQYDPITGRIGNHRTHRRCQDCVDAEENDDWCEPSEYEQGTEDVDVLVAVVGGGTIAEVYGGARKADTDLAARIVNIARTIEVPRRRRRRTDGGWFARDYEIVNMPPNEREIAEIAGCSRAYVRKVLRRLLG